MINNTREIGWNFNNSYAGLPKLFFSSQDPTPVRNPKLVILNDCLAESLGLDAQLLRSEDSISVFAGNSIPEGAKPLAQAYAGHQFGHFTMLGDGRAILIGEQITPEGKKVDIQLKGSGRTQYSRGGDGRAVLGPMLREYVISEAMYALGIPTTRSLAVVTTGESVMREKEQTGAILTRIASSHIRVGTFQYASSWGTVEELRALADYTIQRHFPEIEKTQNKHLNLLKEVINRQATLIAKWQLIGFVHGVMNTDNMAISGETIDYGPCAFIDKYDQQTVFSSIDRQGRYAYGNQPFIAKWNIVRFAESILPLLNDDQAKAIKQAENAIEQFDVVYHQKWLRGMKAKLGIISDEGQQDELLIEEILAIMEKYSADYTNTFVALTFEKSNDTKLFNSAEFKDWYKKWQDRIHRQNETKDASQELMRINNPAVIPRNHKVEQALKAAEEGDYSILKALLNVLSEPYNHSCNQGDYATPPSSNLPYRTYCGT
ncbi:YdiU family protein [Serpentinicella sp. ANB-PHB4]|uniref:protein adenylyltransferase SelO n=1 Tax=Serpentinicella sp. ANB-PHB4 TaxID=3074076 RepID=UPI00285894D4|nr:YdiU family protein [Serpentinicella sp. ANB-PHB4]MDR5660038.1 YdiU family protein [Serpentinicella sp. ANB-PHB4]